MQTPLKHSKKLHVYNKKRENSHELLATTRHYKKSLKGFSFLLHQKMLPKINLSFYLKTNYTTYSKKNKSHFLFTLTNYLLQN